MSKVLVHEPSVERGEHATVVRVDITVPNGEPHTVTYVLPPVEVRRQQVIDAMFVVGRLVAMRGGWQLVLPGPVSRRLLDQAAVMQDLYLEWFGKHAVEMPLDFEAAEPLDLPAGRGAVCTFSGGVDSFFTALERQKELSGLLFVHGLDIGLHHTEFRARVREELAAAAAELALPLWEVETDVRQLTDGYAAWGPKAHGPILSSVAILLAERVDTFYLPGSFSRGVLQGRGWGSHVVTDQLNSTDYLSVVHHGVDTPRPEKTARIAQSASALGHLRVCYTSRTDYNCGSCSKCRRTQIDLDLAGFTDVDRIFAETVPLETAVEEFTVTGMVPQAFAEETITRAHTLGREDVTKPLRRAIKRYEAAQLKGEILRLGPYLRKDPELRALFRPPPRKRRKRRTPVAPPPPPPPPPTLRAVIVHRTPDPVLERLRAVRRTIGARRTAGDRGGGPTAGA